MLSVNAVCKSYGGRQVLNGTDFSVQRGTTTAVLGRSGSGKSTLFNLIAGLDRVDSGEVVIDGKTITRLDETDRTLFRREHIGFIYQSFNLIATLTIEENVRLPMELNGQSRNSSRAATAGILEKVSLGERADSFPHDLSSGEQQRVAIARALVHKPALVLADEPTGNLDSQTGRQVLSLFRDLVHRQGATLLIATHSKIVADSADEVLVIDNGEIARAHSTLAW